MGLSEGEEQARRSALLRRALPLAVGVVGLLATSVLTLAAARANRSTEAELLQRRTSEASAALTTVLPILQVPLSSAAAVTAQTGASEAAFKKVIGGFVQPEGLIQSASLWRLDGDQATRVHLVGAETSLNAQTEARRLELLRSAPASGTGILDLTGADRRAVGFALATAASGPRYVVYLEAPLDEDPTKLDLTGKAFDDLDYAVYLGDEVKAGSLVLATTRDLPLHGRQTMVKVPFGNRSLLVVFTPKGRLTGDLLTQLPWLIAIVGTLLTAAFCWFGVRLQRSGERAEALAADNAALYAEQSAVATVLQRGLLPSSMPKDGRLSVEHRYEAGVDGIEIGGDWYDAVLTDDHHAVLTVGDVSGRGLPAASVMATMRLGLRAFASQGDSPAQILTRLNGLLDISVDHHFATVLCVSIDLETGEMVLASAGHPPPIVVPALPAAEGAPHLVPVEPGLPIGVRRTAAYTELRHHLPAGAIFLAFTDGLFERRGEQVDHSLQRVVRCAADLAGLPLADAIDALIADLESSESPDDTAVLAVRLETTRSVPEASTPAHPEPITQ